MDPLTEVELVDQLRAKGEQDSRNVAALQGALTATGDYEGPIDGLWSPALEAAIVSYQESQDLPATGEIDAATLAALLLADAAQDESTSSSSTSVPASSTTTAAGSPTSTSSTTP